MRNLKEQILEQIRARSLQEAEYLAGEFARAASEQKEAIFAELAFEKWLAESCREVSETPDFGSF